MVRVVVVWPQMPHRRIPPESSQKRLPAFDGLDLLSIHELWGVDQTNCADHHWKRALARNSALGFTDTSYIVKLEAYNLHQMHRASIVSSVQSVGG
jgi:hypothetical protein